MSCATTAVVGKQSAAQSTATVANRDALMACPPALKFIYLGGPAEVPKSGLRASNHAQELTL
jgi:hypothetical protein